MTTKDNSQLILTLLGTGTPIPDSKRHGPSQIIEFPDSSILIDCGPGVLHRLLETDIDVRSINDIYLTHLHSDHVSGLNDLLWAGWVARWWETPPRLTGPIGTKQFLDRLLYAFEEDIRLRSQEGAVTERNLIPIVTEVGDGWSTQKESWKAEAFSVDHFPVKYALGYRFSAAGKTIVISGDTRRCDNLVKYAKDSDILVHEVAWEKGLKNQIESSESAERARFERLLSYHTTSVEVGEIASESNTRHLVLSHLLLAGGTPDDITEDVRKSYKGQLTIGNDLARFTI